MEKSNSQLYFFSPSKCKPSSLHTADLQEDPLKRLSNFLASKLDKLETLRKEKMICEIRSLQDRPYISENSKKLLKHYIPVHKRLEEVVKSRHELKKTLQIQSELLKKSQFKANCTFKTTSKSPTRTPEEFVEHTSTWASRRIQQQEYLKKQKEQQEDLQLTLKPSLSSTTLNLASFRSLTPVFDRLYELKSNQAQKTPTFHPSISPLSSKIIGKRQGDVHSRLYSQRKLNLPE